MKTENNNRDQWRPDHSKVTAQTQPDLIDQARIHLSNQIACRAYFLYLEDGAQPGHDLAHWLQAETELFRERDDLRAEQPPQSDATQKRSAKQTPGFVL